MANRSFESGCILRLRDSACPGSSGFTFSTAQGLGASPCEEPVDEERHDEAPERLQNTDYCDELRPDATENESRARGTRTPNQRIMSSLL